MIFFPTNLLFLLFSLVDTVRILAILPFASKSHNAVFQKYVDGLHERGHELIVVSAFPTTHNLQNYTSINIANAVFNITDSLKVDSEVVAGSIFQHLYLMLKFEQFNCHGLLSHPQLRTLYTSNEKLFDLIIMESYYIPCYLPLAAVQNVPVVWLLAPSRMYLADLAVGNINNPSYFPLVIRKYEFSLSNSPSFKHRLQNFQYYLLNYLYSFYFAYVTENICHKYFDDIGLNCNSNNLLKKVSLVLTYGNSVLYPRPVVPNYVEIGGLHIKPTEPLPQDLQQFLDDSTEDVLFVSFGSVVKISIAEERFVNALLEAFSECNCRILWRSDLNASTSRIPKNVLARDWFPQRDILAHKKVKAFLSHGGLFSVYEAIYTSTPIIGVPLFFDQVDNIMRIEELGAGIYLSYHNIFTDLKIAMNEIILNNSKYAENMKILSKLVQDEPMTPMDKAMYWTEYVIRHNGALHLQSSAVLLPVYKYLLFDVLVATVFMIVIVLYLLMKIGLYGLCICDNINCRIQIKKRQ